MLRKGSLLSGIRTARRTSVPDLADYQFASEIAARFLEHRSQATLDQILCDPALAAEFDGLAAEITPGFYQFAISLGGVEPSQDETASTGIAGSCCRTDRGHNWPPRMMSRWNPCQWSKAFISFIALGPLCTWASVKISDHESKNIWNIQIFVRLQDIFGSTAHPTCIWKYVCYHRQLQRASGGHSKQN